MNDQPPSPVQPSTNLSPKGPVNIVGILIVFLGLGLILFAVLSIYAFGIAHKATSTLSSQKAMAVQLAVAAQKKSDAKAQLSAVESPYRSYTAAQDFGSFIIYFPKNWSGYAQTSTQATVQVNLALNPDFVTATNGVLADPVATRVQLVQELQSVAEANFTSLVKAGQLKQQDVTVSGIKGVEYTGTFQDQKTVAEVLIPVRGQTMTLSCENAQYLPEFNTILSQAKVNP
jgi:hypothetical protein